MLKFLRIISWNTQGDFAAKVSDSYGMLCSRGDFDVLQIQEAGATKTRDLPLVGAQDYTFGKTNYSGLFQPQEGVLNRRCTTGLLLNSKFNKSGNVYAEQIDGVKRPLVEVELTIEGSSILVATIHATASPAAAKKELNVIVSYLRSKAHTWILMGDFNVDPKVFYASTTCPGIRILSTNSVTQQSGHELDYAIVSENIMGGGVIRLNPYSSDHSPICAEINFL